MPDIGSLFRGKHLFGKAGNSISVPPDFKIFWGRIPPDPPEGLHLQCSLSQQPTISNQPSTSKINNSPVNASTSICSESTCSRRTL